MTELSPADLRQTLVLWLESQREAYLGAAHVAGVAPSVPLRFAVATEVGEHTSTIEYEIRSVSPVFVSDLVWALGRIVEETGSEPAPVSEVLAVFGEGAVPWSPFFPDDVRRQVELLLGAAAREYLSELESLETSGLALAEEHVGEIVELFASDNVLLVTALPLGGISPPAEPLSVDHLRLRRLIH